MENAKSPEKEKKVNLLINEIEQGLDEYGRLVERVGLTVERIEFQDPISAPEGGKDDSLVISIIDKLATINNKLCSRNANLKQKINILEDLI